MLACTDIWTSDGQTSICKQGDQSPGLRIPAAIAGAQSAEQSTFMAGDTCIISYFRLDANSTISFQVYINQLCHSITISLRNYEKTYNLLILFFLFYIYFLHFSALSSRIYKLFPLCFSAACSLLSYDTRPLFSTCKKRIPPRKDFHKVFPGK